MRLISFCKSKIHRATVTHTDRDYIGSIAIDADLLDRTGLVPGEKVAVWNVTNGEVDGRPPASRPMPCRRRAARGR